jgi:uncharacterized peroxidase-related enzyme
MSGAEHLLEGIQKTMGMVPNIFKLMANSPVVLEAYLNFSGALSKGQLSGQEREHIALAMAGFTHCEYCAAAHTVIAQKQGVPGSETQTSLKGKSPDPKIQALLSGVLEIVHTHGNLSEQTRENMRAVGYSEALLTEIVAQVTVNLFTNYFNHVAKSPLDFPKVNLD